MILIPSVIMYDQSIILELPFILFNFSEQSTLYTIIDFNFMALCTQITELFNIVEAI